MTPHQGGADLIFRATNVRHSYGENVALDNVSLDVLRGEFLVILGESGSGKTTMLRVISGLEHATSVDELTLDGVDVSSVPAAQRNCTTVFQSYALFPHMSVEENVAYGLKLRGVPAAERKERAKQALEMVRLGTKGNRRISQLSGGERQRVALARAIVTKPAVLLLDEPLGALDERLRYDMQAELVELHRTLGMTFIYITHSQEEALTMSDRIVLMRKGRIEQSGTPEELFDRPTSRFAAEFMGFDNVLEAVVVGEIEDGRVPLRVAGAVVHGTISEGAGAGAGVGLGDRVLLAVRAERLVPKRGAMVPVPGMNVLPCSPHSSLYRGKYTDINARLVGDIPLRVRTWDQSADNSQFDAVTCRIEDCVVLRS
jgi:ABC-type Fe3+/spermidine/putrescine transport system ATPase subunit